MRPLRRDPARLRGQLLLASALIVLVVVVNALSPALTAPLALVCLIAIGVAAAVWPSTPPKDPRPRGRNNGERPPDRGAESPRRPRRGAGAQSERYVG